MNVNKCIRYRPCDNVNKTDHIDQLVATKLYLIFPIFIIITLLITFIPVLVLLHDLLIT